MSHENEFAICIMTFSKRLEQVMKLVHSFRAQTTADIFLGVNGPYKPPFDQEYRKSILNFCAAVPNTYCSFSVQFRGVAYTWNDMLVHCGHEYALINNDDIEILPGYMDEVTDFYFNKTDKGLTRVNSAFGSFFVSKTFMNAHGWFNEHYLGLGWEEIEFLDRRGHRTLPCSIFNTPKLVHIGLQPEFTKDIVSEGAKTVGTAKGLEKYHSFNKGLYDGKSHNEPSASYRPYEKFYMDNYATFW